MKARSGSVLAALAILAALLLWLGLRVDKKRRLAGQRPPLQAWEETTEARPAGRGKVGAGGRKLTLGLGLALAVLGLGVGAVVLAAADGPVAPSGDTAAASSNGTTEGAGAAGPTPAPTAASPAPPDPDGSPPDVAPGGDLPIGPPTSLVTGEIAENVGVSAEFLALQDTLSSEIEAYRALVGDIEVAIAVRDLQTGETISVNGNVPQRTGCTINMFALLAAVGEFEAGRASPSQVAYNIQVGIGASYPPQVKQFVQTLFGSHQAGVERAREMMSSWGMEASLFDHVPYYGDGSQNNLLTALETNAVLAKLYRGELFDPEWTAYTLARLREIKPGLNYMLPGQLPAAATVAHKIGYYWDWDGWVNADAGIVTLTGSDGEEKAYAITYLSQKAPTEYTGYSFGARLSRIVWDWFEAKYELGTEPPPPPPPPLPPPPPPPAPTAAPTPSPTPSPSPTATPTPEASPTPAPSPSPSPTPMPEPTPVPTPGSVPVLTPPPGSSSGPTP